MAPASSLLPESVASEAVEEGSELVDDAGAPRAWRIAGGVAAADP